jgi:hypothetical protein
MIDCLSFKRVWRLLHRYVVPGLCASAISLGGCAVRATTVSKAYAVRESGGRIEPLKLGLAIEKAGGADKLFAALGGRGLQSEKVDPEKDDLGPVRSANSHCVVRTGFLVAVIGGGLLGSREFAIA